MNIIVFIKLCDIVQLFTYFYQYIVLFIIVFSLLFMALIKYQ